MRAAGVEVRCDAEGEVASATTLGRSRKNSRRPLTWLDANRDCNGRELQPKATGSSRVGSIGGGWSPPVSVWSDLVLSGLSTPAWRRSDGEPKKRGK